MDELYRAIEDKIKSAGYTRQIDGQDVYDDLCEQIDDKEPGNYIMLSKFLDDVVFEYTVTVMEEDFNLSTLTITDGGQKYVVDFDA